MLNNLNNFSFAIFAGNNRKLSIPGSVANFANWPFQIGRLNGDLWQVFWRADFGSVRKCSLISNCFFKRKNRFWSNRVVFPIKILIAPITLFRLFVGNFTKLNVWKSWYQINQLCLMISAFYVLRRSKSSTSLLRPFLLRRTKVYVEVKSLGRSTEKDEDLKMVEVQKRSNWCVP